jgi:hypothetical protein
MFIRALKFCIHKSIDFFLNWTGSVKLGDLPGFENLAGLIIFPQLLIPLSFPYLPSVYGFL